MHLSPALPACPVMGRQPVPHTPGALSFTPSPATPSPTFPPHSLPPSSLTLLFHPSLFLVTPGCPILRRAGSVMGDMQDLIRKLKLQVQQRDNEINILVSMLKKHKGGEGGGQAGGGGGGGAPLLGPSVPSPGKPGAPSPSSSMDQAVLHSRAGAGAASSSSSAGVRGEDEMAVLMDASLLADRNKAFELFRKSYRQNEVRVGGGGEGACVLCVLGMPGISHASLKGTGKKSPYSLL